MKPGFAPAPVALRRSARWLAVIGAGTLALTGECQPLVLGAFLSFFLLGLKIESMPHFMKLIRPAQPVLGGIVFIMSVMDFFTLSNSFLLAIAHFLLAVQGLRLLIMGTNRDCLGSVLISSLMILSASTLSVSWTFFTMLMLYLPLAIHALMLQNLALENASLSETGAPAWGDLAEGGWLWGRTMSFFRRAAALATLVTAGTCAVVFVAFPRLNLQGYRGRFLQPVHRSGFSSRIDLNQSERIFEDRSVVMRVEVPESERNLWPGYLRGDTLSLYEGAVWKKPSGHLKRLYWRQSHDISVPLVLRKGRWLHQSIYLESMDSPLLFAVSQPVQIHIDRLFLDWEEDGSLQRGAGDTWRVHYNVDSLVTDSIPQDPGLSLHAPQSEPRVAPLASDACGPRIAALAHRIVPAGTAPREAARRIERYLRTGYRYTLNTGPLPHGENALENFLFESKAGHCEYFASAMALMLREVGVPSRVVLGFYSREWNQRGGYFIVRMQDSHAWVEAYLQPDGWTRFDPSPRVLDSPSSQSWLTRAAELEDALNLQWNRYVLSYDMERQVDILVSLGRSSKQFSSRFGGWSGIPGRWHRVLRWPGMGWPGAGGGAERVILGCLAAGGAFWGGVLLWKMKLAKSVNPLWFTRELIRILEKKNRPRQPHETLREFSHEFMAKKRGPAADVDFLERTYYRLRFDPGAVLSGPDRLAVMNALRRMREWRRVTS